MLKDIEQQPRYEEVLKWHAILIREDWKDAVS
jgi:hypothetical protein